MRPRRRGPGPVAGAPGLRHPHRRRLPSVAARVAAATLLTVAVSGAYASAAAPADTAMARQIVGRPTVGALFVAGATTHYCTASVVSSSTGDVLITAAHCIDGSGRGLTFVPGFHDGQAPYGRWPVVAAYGPPGWRAAQRTQRDVAFLRVARIWWRGRLRTVQQVTGSNRLVTNLTAGRKVTVTAYDDDPPGRPVTCTNRVVWEGSYPRFDCDAYVDGSSGAPWLARSSSGADVVVGVIGGLHQGGCQSWSSYSAAFGPDTELAYQRAVAGGGGDTFPVPGPDGCTSGL